MPRKIPFPSPVKKKPTLASKAFQLPKKAKDGPEKESIEQGISSLHAWIKTQTMIRPNKLRRKKKKKTEERAADSDSDDEYHVIKLRAEDPQLPDKISRLDLVTGQYYEIKVCKTR